MVRLPALVPAPSPLVPRNPLAEGPAPALQAELTKSLAVASSGPDAYCALDAAANGNTLPI